jgi:hypothetical protein
MVMRELTDAEQFVYIALVLAHIVPAAVRELDLISERDAVEQDRWHP